MAEIPLTDLTDNRKDGEGVFDKLMESMDDHIREEYKKGRIQGSDYSKVYLGGLQTTMQQAIAFLLGKQEADKKADLLGQQVETEKLNSDLVAAQIAKIQAEISLMAKQELKLDQDILVAKQEVLFSIAKVEQMQNQALLTQAQVAKTVEEVAIAQYQKLVMEQEVEFSKAKVSQMIYEAELTLAKTDLTNQQVQNAIAETLVTTRQADKIEQDTLVAEQQVLNMKQEVLKTTQEVLNMQAQVTLTTNQAALIGQQQLTEVQNTALTIAKTSLTTQQTTNLVSEELKTNAEVGLITKQGLKIDQEVLNMQQQVLNLVSEELKIDAETALITQNTANALTQNGVILNQANKLLAEIDLLKSKTDIELAQIRNSFTSAYTNATLTVNASGNDAPHQNGTLGMQKVIYNRQADGFLRDAEQKMAKIMSDSWAVRFSQDPNAADVDASQAGLSNARITTIIADAIEGVTGAAPPA